MKFTRIIASAAICAVGIAASEPSRQVLITYPDDTPQATLNDAKSTLIAMGGQILHEFKLIKGFVVKTTSQALESLNSLSIEYKPIIEADGPAYAVDTKI